MNYGEGQLKQWKRVNFNIKSIFRILNSYPQNLNLEEGQLKQCPVSYQFSEFWTKSTKFEFELGRRSTLMSNQFLEFGTPIHKFEFELGRGSTWTFNQFLKFLTPNEWSIELNSNLNLNLEGGQLKQWVVNFQSIFKILQFNVASCRLCRFRSKKAILEVARQICKSKAGVFACWFDTP